MENSVYECIRDNAKAHNLDLGEQEIANIAVEKQMAES